MRYLIGLTGAVLVAALLLVFQRELLGSERNMAVSPPVVLALPQATKPKPPEEKIRTPRAAPEPPPPVETFASYKPPERHRTERPKAPLTGLRGIDGGQGPYLAGGVTLPTLDGGIAPTMMMEPQYPRGALAKGVEGEVEVEFTVLADGTVAEVAILRADPPGVFDRAVRQAVQRWKFLPRRINGEPVAARARHVLQFRLSGNEN